MNIFSSLIISYRPVAGMLEGCFDSWCVWVMADLRRVP